MIVWRCQGGRVFAVTGHFSAGVCLSDGSVGNVGERGSLVSGRAPRFDAEQRGAEFAEKDLCWAWRASDGRFLCGFWCAPKGAVTLWVQVPPGQWSVWPGSWQAVRSGKWPYRRPATNAARLGITYVPHRRLAVASTENAGCGFSAACRRGVMLARHAPRHERQRLRQFLRHRHIRFGTVIRLLQP
ncbi:MAG: hypothetical protein QOF70_6944 [Acetobacteraceae bacterium]|jgi:hypothetical protein|nr:hypothetical protein [Acetobacteraceae bacterium]